ncbi:outer membrane beta-barrel protein [Persephonella sp.]|nr:outer membrane beta-barrel protein [Aquificota bacterium]
MKKVMGLAAAGLLAAGTASAGTLTVANSDMTMGGGVTAGYFYVTNNGAGQNTDYFTVSNFVIDLKGKSGIISYKASFGSVVQPDLLEGTLSKSSSFGLSYGWVTISPVEGLSIDAGKLTTNIGYELYHTYDNKNYTFGLVWWGQPVTYPGARVNYSVADGVDVYAEYTQDTAGSVFTVSPTDAYAVGVIGSMENVSYAVSYFDYNKTKNLIDVVLSTEIEGFELGLNFDYQWMDDTAKKALQNAGATSIDDTAYGIALYVSTKVDVFELPVRIEYVNDGSATDAAGNVVCDGIYGVAGDSAWSFTVTPTYRPSANTYVRAEFAYVSTDKKGFSDDKGNAKDSRTVIGVEAGFLF